MRSDDLAVVRGQPGVVNIRSRLMLVSVSRSSLPEKIESCPTFLLSLRALRVKRCCKVDQVSKDHSYFFIIRELWEIEQDSSNKNVPCEGLL